MEIINRSAAVIKPKKIFTDMLRSINAIPTSFSSLRNDCNVILIPDFDARDDAVDYIRNNYQMILRNELKDWLGGKETDKFLVNVSYSLFQMWFDVEIHQTVRDAIKDDLVDAPAKSQDEENVVNTDEDIIPNHITAPDEESYDEEDLLYLDLTLPYSESEYNKGSDNTSINLFS